jgi:hypothetical protein
MTIADHTTNEDAEAESTVVTDAGQTQDEVQILTWILQTFGGLDEEADPE